MDSRRGKKKYEKSVNKGKRMGISKLSDDNRQMIVCATTYFNLVGQT